MNEPVAIGIVGRARGLAGECWVTALGQTLRNLACPAHVFIGREPSNVRPIVLESAVPRGQYMVCRFAEVCDRGTAEQLQSLTIFVERSMLPVLPDGCYYEFELIGLKVFDRDRMVGEVRAVRTFPSVSALEVEWCDRRTVLVPMNAEVVKRIDVSERRIVIDGAVLAELL